MPTFRVHYQPRHTRLLEDVVADELCRDTGGGLTLWGWTLILGYPRRVVALRVRQGEVHHVENLCRPIPLDGADVPGHLHTV